MMCISKSICGYLQKKPTGHLAPISCPFPSGQKCPAHSMIFQYKHASRAYPARIEMCTPKGNDKMVVLMSLAHASQAQSESLPLRLVNLPGGAAHGIGNAVPPAQKVPAEHNCPISDVEPTGHEDPGSQSQVSALATPPEQKDPSGQGTPSGCELPSGQNLPAWHSQSRGASIPPTQNLPCMHLTPAPVVAPAGQKNPGAAVHSAASSVPPRQNLPAGHLIPSGLAEPGGQKKPGCAEQGSLSPIWSAE